MREWWEGFERRRSPKDFKRIFEDSIRVSDPGDLGPDATDAINVRNAIISSSNRKLKSPHNQFHKATKEDFGISSSAKPSSTTKPHFIEKPKSKKNKSSLKNKNKLVEVTMYTHGQCANGSIGSYATVLELNPYRKVISCRCKNTNTKRMELLSIIVGLETLKKPCYVTVYTDSSYIAGIINKPWIKAWKERYILPEVNVRDVNFDLWRKFLSLCRIHEVCFMHYGEYHPENKKCVTLAKESMGIPPIE
jgi:ribonuclease HI